MARFFRFNIRQLKFYERSFDARRQRRQRPLSFSNPRFSGTLNCAATLWRENGIRTFYRGLSAVVGRAFVMNGVTLTVYNVCQYELMQYWRIDDE